eukprot:367861-Rhodomonas_salina.1
MSCGATSEREQTIRPPPPISNERGAGTLRRVVPESARVITANSSCRAALASNGFILTGGSVERSITRIRSDVCRVAVLGARDTGCCALRVLAGVAGPSPRTNNIVRTFARPAVVERTKPTRTLRSLGTVLAGERIWSYQWIVLVIANTVVQKVVAYTLREREFGACLAVCKGGRPDIGSERVLGTRKAGRCCRCRFVLAGWARGADIARFQNAFAPKPTSDALLRFETLVEDCISCWAILQDKNPVDNDPRGTLDDGDDIWTPRAL